jgi:hypothetical protein
MCLDSLHGLPSPRFFLYLAIRLPRTLLMKKGRCGTMTHDYKRNGTTCLFAALNVLDGTVIGTKLSQSFQCDYDN